MNASCPSWDEVSQRCKETVVLFSRHQDSYGAMAFLHTIRDFEFSYTDQLFILNYLHGDNYFYQDLIVSPSVDFYQYPTLGDRIVAILDTWEMAWTAAIHTGIPYKGHNEFLNSQYAILVD